jgi:hypothetical protein
MSRLVASHWLLLRIAGIAPDDLVHRCRGWLAEGRALDVGRAVTYAVLSQRIRLTDADLDLLAELLAADGMDTSALSMVAVDDADPMPLHSFAASKAGIGSATGTSAADGAPTNVVTSAEPEDDTEAQILAAVAVDPSVRAMWRVWRFPSGGAPWPPPRRIWVVEASAEANLPKTTGRIQTALERYGEFVPQVEVYPIGAEPPSYQQLARACGALIWSRDPDPGIKVAATVTAANRLLRPRLSDEERFHVDAYLRSGVVVRMIATRADDLVTSDRSGAVPMSLITDGSWIWSEATTYYLEVYGIAPDRGLLAHIRARRYAPSMIDGASLHRIMVFAHDPAIDNQIWPMET